MLTSLFKGPLDAGAMTTGPSRLCVSISYPTCCGCEGIFKFHLTSHLPTLSLNPTPAEVSVGLSNPQVLRVRFPSQTSGTNGA